MIDFSSLLSSVVFKLDRIIIVADFKIHTDETSDPLGTETLQNHLT